MSEHSKNQDAAPQLPDINALREYPWAVAFVLRAVQAVNRPALAHLYSEALTADNLCKESEIRRTGEPPGPKGLVFSPVGKDISVIANLNYFGFSMAQSLARNAFSAAVVFSIDADFRQLKQLLRLDDAVEGGPSFGSGVRLTRFVRAIGNQIRHAANWRELDKTSRNKSEDFVALQSAGLNDPLSASIPIDAIRLIGSTYFDFEEAITKATEDLILSALGPMKESDQLDLRVTFDTSIKIKIID